MEITEENIHEQARKGNVDVLSHPSVDIMMCGDEWTPLHTLARSGFLEVLKHPSVDKVVDSMGRTPLHEIAWTGKIEVLDHPSVDKVKNSWGVTPLHILFDKGSVSREWLVKKYPWFPIEGNRITHQLITKML